MTSLLGAENVFAISLSILPYFEMPQAEMSSRFPNFDAYFETVQSKKLPSSLRASSTTAFAQILVPPFPEVPGGKVSVCVHLSMFDVHVYMCVPSRMHACMSACACVHVGCAWINNSCMSGSRCCWCSGSSSLSATGPVAVAWLTIAAVGAAVAAGMAAEKGIRNWKDAPTAADKLGKDIYKVLLQEEPFKSTTVKSIVQSYCWAPLLLGGLDSSMLTVLLSLSKYRLTNAPVIDTGKPYINNFVTRTAVEQCLKQMKGRGLINQLDTEKFSVFAYHRKSSLFSYEVVKYLKQNVRPLAVMDFVKTLCFTIASSATCAPEACHGTVIDSVASISVHRIYVIEGDDREVVGAVTLRNLYVLIRRKDRRFPRLPLFLQLAVLTFVSGHHSRSKRH
ncbi:SNF1-related protein kinase regulatory subunit gamma-1-like [Elaeis guineensis]|uniref:SNF1-related protein kinase regulatory subunit gamma-1-like n=1 Tax=Elaeis guineensis var. tenera TaxID=51953 RepID=UPI003C6CCB35